MRLTNTAQRTVIVIALLATLCACRPIALLNAASPSSHYERVENLAYGSLPRQRMDIYQPVVKPRDAPLVVFFYGGGWKDGAKADYEFVASALTEAGFVVAIPDYRLFPQVQFPAFVNDGAEAVAFAMRQAQQYGATDTQVYLMGHSAGAHIAALLALDRHYLRKANAPRNQIAGLVGLSGPYDFLPIDSGYLVDVFPSSSRKDSQPVAFASSDAPPALLVHGGKDDLVDSSNALSLADALRSRGASAELKIYPDLDHKDTAIELAPPLDFIGSVLEDCIAFIRRVSQETADDMR